MLDLTVILPFYNEENVLLHCAESVFSLCCSFELILWDRGSTDATPFLCQSYAEEKRVRYIRGERQDETKGMWETVLQESRGQYLTFVRARDEILPRGVQKQLQFSEQRHLDWCAGEVVQGRSRWRREEYREQYLAGYCLQDSKTLLERMRWEQIEGKLYRREWLIALSHGGKLPSCFTDSVLFNLTIAGGAKRVGYVPEPCYKKGKKTWNFSTESIFI